MKHNAIITMKSIQTLPDDKSETELITKGTFEITDDSYIISYDDTEATGFKGATTEISVRGNEFASVIRRGAAASDLILEAGRKHHCQYGTPYGTMEIGVYTNTIKTQLDENGGDVYFKYTLDINTSYISENEIIINIKKA